MKSKKPTLTKDQFDKKIAITRRELQERLLILEALELHPVYQAEKNEILSRDPELMKLIDETNRAAIEPLKRAIKYISERVEN